MRKVSRGEWIAGSFEALCLGGIEAVRVESLARQLGVTKGSFYHHFENRRALHIALLEEWERLGTSDIINEVEQRDTEPFAQLTALIHKVFAVDPVADVVETSIRAWAATDGVAAATAKRVDDRRLAFVALLLEGIGLAPGLAQQRARMMYRVLIGEFIWRTAGGPSSTTDELDSLAALLVRSPGPVIQEGLVTPPA